MEQTRLKMSIDTLRERLVKYGSTEAVHKYTNVLDIATDTVTKITTGLKGIALNQFKSS